MEIAVMCNQCIRESLKPHFPKISVNEEGFYHYKCNYNHDNLLVLQAFKFELLFESGLCAIRDKFYLESVLSIHASLERFYEFYIKIISTQNGLDLKNYEKMFKHISRQSERQYGAFIVLYTIINKEPPALLLDQNGVEFRNKVVHKGYLPNESEVLEYAEKVYEVIKLYYQKLLQEYHSVIFDMLAKEFEIKREKNKSLIEKLDMQVGTFAPLFSFTTVKRDGDHFKKSFEACYADVKKYHYLGAISFLPKQ